MKEIQIKCQGAGTLPLENLTQFQGNLKTITPANLKKLRSRIIDTGFVAPIFIWKNEKINYILDGHQRILALLSLQGKGYHIPDLPVAYIEADNEEDARKKLLSITSTYGDFNLEELQGWLVKVDEDIADSLRFFDKELNFELTEEKETIGDDEVNEEVEPVTKLGDLWELGEHRLLCGDSTDKETVEKLMDGCYPDIIQTDPPYGMKAVSKSGVLSKTYKKDIVGDDNPDVAKDAFKLIYELYINSKHVWWGANYYCSVLPDSECWLVWDKNNGESDQTDCELAWGNFRSVVRQFTMASEKTNRVHPTQKPVQLIEWIFRRFKLTAETIADFFGGSGYTIIAAEKNNKISYTMEFDGHFVDVIVNRYVKWCEKNSRTPVIKLNGEVYKWPDLKHTQKNTSKRSQYS